MSTNKHSNSRRSRAARVLLMLAVLAGGAQAALAAVFHVDVAVVGAGSAGLSAAIAAREAGAEVMVFEKMTMAGGNSIRSTGHFTAVGSSLQQHLGVKADAEILYEDIIRRGGSSADPKLVRRLVDESGKAADWLATLGVDIGRVRPVPGTKEYRLMRPAADTNVGAEIINGLLCAAESLGIPMQFESRVVELLTKNGAVTGFRAESPKGMITVKAKAVILATGGFASSETAISRLSPEGSGHPTTNAPGAVGEGLALAEHCGASFVDLGELQYHPTAVPLSGRIVPESIRIDGAILVNDDGRRFVNELGDSETVTRAIFEQGDWCWLVGDRNVAAAAPQMRYLILHESVIVARDADELAARIGVNSSVLRGTLEDYRNGAAQGHDAFGRDTFATDLTHSPLYALRVRPAIHCTPGGIRIDKDARVIDKDGHPIRGLYAAGEVTGGVHGRRRLEDTALTDAVVFGLTAGRNAAVLSRSASSSY